MATLKKNLEILKELNDDASKTVSMSEHIETIVNEYGSKENFKACQDIIKFALDEKISSTGLLQLVAHTDAYKAKLDRTDLFNAIKALLKLHPDFNLENLKITNITTKTKI